MLALMVNIVLIAFSMSAGAATFLVDTTADTQDAAPGNGVCADSTGACSLRAAITEANALAGPDTITLPAGTYTRTLGPNNENANAGGDFDITSAITINGAGSLTTIIQGAATQAAATERVVDFVPGAIATATINDVTIRNGNQVATGGFGGGIRNNGAAGSILNLNRCVVTTCRSADRGGGVSLAVASAATQLNLTDLYDQQQYNYNRRGWRLPRRRNGDSDQHNRYRKLDQFNDQQRFRWRPLRVGRLDDTHQLHRQQ